MKFEERLRELRCKYSSVNEFDFITILRLEDEYNNLIKNNPEHTRRRGEVLRMRKELIDRLEDI